MQYGSFLHEWWFGLRNIVIKDSNILLRTVEYDLFFRKYAYADLNEMQRVYVQDRAKWKNNIRIVDPKSMCCVQGDMQKREHKQTLQQCKMLEKKKTSKTW